MSRLSSLCYFFSITPIIVKEGQANKDFFLTLLL
jgi:hypothetical protein